MQPAPAPRLRALHTLALFAFAVAQPLLDLLGRNVESLTALQADGLDLALIAFVVALGAPGAAVLAKWALERMAARFAPAIHLAAVAALAAAIALLVLKEGDAGETPGWVLVPGALALGAAAAILYARSRFASSFLTVISPALLVFPLLFLFASPAGQRLVPVAAWRPGAGDAPAALASDTPVVMVVFSGLPLTSLLDESMEIDPHLFPNFAALAERAHFFRNATTVAQTASYALPAIATGLYPAWTRPPTAAAYPQNLFTLLGESHELNVFEAVTRLCELKLCAVSATEISRPERLTAIFSKLHLLYLHQLLPEDWTHRLPDITAAWREFSEPEPGYAEARFRELRRRSDDLPWIFSQFLARVFDRGKPTLHFLHAILPDGPYRYLPSGRRYRPTAIHPDARQPRGGAADVEWAETQALQRHLLQVGYADTFLGRMLERLESEGLFDRALVVVTADHGVSLRPGLRHRRLQRDDKNAGDMLLVPLLIKLPGQREGSVSDRNVETVDILPTILDVVDLEPPEPLEGRSLLDASVPERPQKVVYRAPRRGEVLERRRKVLGPILPSALGTVHRISEIFGRGRGREALFAVGEHHELLGRIVATDADSRSSPFAVRLDGLAGYDEVNPDSALIPAHVTGRLEAEALPANALDLAVAVNGVVRAVTRSFAHKGHTARFTAMVPEEAFRRGHNEIEIFLVREDAKGIALLAGELRPAATYSVVLTHDRRPGLVLSSEGHLYPVIPNAVRGRVSRSGNAFIGEATDLRHARAAEAVLMFAGGSLQQVRTLKTVTAGGAESTGASSSDALQLDALRFSFPIPKPWRQDVAERDLHFLGLAEGAASELDYEASRPGPEAWSGPSSALAIERRDESEGITASSGEWIPLRAGGLRGRVETAPLLEGEVAFSGWAADIDGGTVPRAVLVFVDGGFVETAEIALARPDVAAELGSASFEHSGFRTELPGELVGEEREVRFLVPAASSAVAELEYPEGDPFAPATDPSPPTFSD